MPNYEGGSVEIQIKATADKARASLEALSGVIRGLRTDLQGLTSTLDGINKTVDGLRAIEKLNMSKVSTQIDAIGTALGKMSDNLARTDLSGLRAFAAVSKNLGATSIPKMTQSLTDAQSAAKNLGTTIANMGTKLKRGITGIIGFIKNLGSQSDKTNKSLSSMFSIGKIYFFINYTKRAVQALGGMMKAAIDFTEIENLFSRSMGSMRAEAIRFQNTLSETFGLALPDMMKSQALFNNIVKQLGGINEAMSAGISETLVKMSIDFSALYNQSIETAFDTFQAAMTGQVKPIRRVAGMDITQTTLQAYLDEAGINRTVRSLNQVEKRLLTVYSLQRQMAESRAIGAYAEEIENAANQLKILTEQVKEFGRWLGSIFMGTIGNVLPYLNGFVMVLKEIAKTLAMLVGYQLPDSSNLNEQLGLEDANDGLDAAASGLEKVKNAVTGIDELNIIAPTQAADTAGVGGVVDPAILGLLTEYDNLMSGVRMKALDIRDAIMEWLGFVQKVNEETGEISWEFVPTLDESYFYDLGFRLAELINTGLASINWENIKKTVAGIARNIASFLNGAIAGANWALIGATIGEAINTALFFVYNWLTTFDFLAWGAAIATGLNGAIDAVDWALLGATFAAYIMSLFNMAFGFVTTFDWSAFGASIGESINTFFADIDWATVGATISTGIKGLLGLITSAITKIDWKKIGEDIKTFLINIDWAGIWTAVTEFVKSVFMGFRDVLTVIFGSPEAADIILGILTALAVVIGTISAALGIYNAVAAIAAIATNALFLPVLLITGAIAALVAGIILLIQNWDSVKEVAAKVWDGIVNVWNTVATWFSNNIIQPLGKLFSGLWDGVTSGAANVWLGIKKGVVGMANGVIKVINAMIKGVLAPFNLLIDGLNLIPGVDIKKLEFSIPNIPIPEYRLGGFPEDGFFFANSQELIGSVGGRTAVANNDQIVTAVAQGVAQAVAAVLSSQPQQRDNRPISVVIDGREVVRAVRNGETNMGANPIGGAFANA